MQLVALVIHQKHLALPHLVDLSADNGAHLVLILLVEGIVVELKDFRSQRLAQVEDGAASELGEVDVLTHFLTHLIVGLNLQSLRQRNLLVLILHLIIVDDDAVAVNLEVALVGVYNHVEVLVRAEQLGQHVAEALLQHTD